MLNSASQCGKSSFFESFGVLKTPQNISLSLSGQRYTLRKNYLREKFALSCLGAKDSSRLTEISEDLERLGILGAETLHTIENIDFAPQDAHVTVEGESVDIHFGVTPMTVKHDGIIMYNGVVKIFAIEWDHKLTERGHSRATNAKTSPHAVALYLAARAYCDDKKITYTEIIPVIVSCKQLLTNKGKGFTHCLVKKNLDVVIADYEREAFYNLPLSTKSSCNSCHSKTLCQGQLGHCFAPVAPTAPKKEEFTPPSLTDEQEEIALTTNGVFKIRAEAGSGKTATMCDRAMNLIAFGGTVWITSFTNASAQELRDRILRIAASQGIAPETIKDQFVVSTFNAMGDIVAKDSNCWPELGFKAEPSLITDVEKKALVLETFEMLSNTSRTEAVLLTETLKLNFSSPYYSLGSGKGAVVHLLQLFEGDTTNDDWANLDPAIQVIVSAMRDYYLELKAKRNLYDFADQISFVKTALKNNWDCVNYGHLIADEFQDANNDLLEIVQLFQARKDDCYSVMVVGDPQQSIYSFRGSDPSLFDFFDFHFPDVQELTLSKNFRCPLNIQTAAKRVITHGVLSSEKDSSESPTSFSVIAKDTLANEIETLNNPDESTVVLARTKKDLLEIEAYLNNAGIQTVLQVPTLLTESLAVQGVLSLCSFLKYGNVKDYAVFAKANGMDFNEDFSFALTRVPFVTKLREEASDIHNKYNSAVTEPDGSMEYVVSLISQVKSLDVLVAQFVKSLELANFSSGEDLIDYCISYVECDTKVYSSPNLEEPTPSGTIVLTTNHSSKGLQWDNVFLCRPETTPVLISLNGLVGEEARLLYVAMTRAKKKLTFVASK